MNKSNAELGFTLPQSVGKLAVEEILRSDPLHFGGVKHDIHTGFHLRY